MDPDLVRLILVVLGVLLVVGIYLWDRYKRSLPQMPRRRRRPAAPAADAARPARGEPTLDEPMAEQQLPSGAAEVEPAAARPGPGASSALDPEPADIGDWSAPLRDEDPQFAMDLKFDAHGEGDYLSTDPALYGEVERKIVVINLVARDGVLSGPAIERACAAVGLAPGDMSIYHRRAGGDGGVIFSMASMVEPGSFPFDDMDDFTTPGLSMFTQLPGVRDGVEIYDAMLATAERLAKTLNAELKDERHNKLTRQMQEHTRESIIQHRHKTRLARSRH
jgi:cell division protein ZipA